jgi:ribA/ribD-fused uncharacterized protein
MPMPVNMIRTVATTRSKKGSKSAVMQSPMNRSPRKAGKQLKKYYSVAAGWKMGIFHCWEGNGGGKESTLNFKCNEHKGHPNLKEAVMYLNERGFMSSDIIVYDNDGKELPLSMYDGTYTMDVQDEERIPQQDTIHMNQVSVNKINVETNGKEEEINSECCVPESVKTTSDTNKSESSIPGSNINSQIISSSTHVNHTRSASLEIPCTTLTHRTDVTPKSDGTLCNRCDLANDDNMIQCDNATCKSWTHYRCSELPGYFLSFLCEREDEPYKCRNCIVPRDEITKAICRQENKLKKGKQKNISTQTVQNVKLNSKEVQTNVTDVITAISAADIKSSIEAMEKHVITNMRDMHQQQVKVEHELETQKLLLMIEKLEVKNKEIQRNLKDLNSENNKGIASEIKALKEKLCTQENEYIIHRREEKTKLKQISLAKEGILKESHQERKLKNLAESNAKRLETELQSTKNELEKAKSLIEAKDEQMKELKRELQGMSGGLDPWTIRQPSTGRKTTKQHRGGVILFRGPNDMLSNFYTCNIEIRRITVHSPKMGKLQVVNLIVKSSEHAYQYIKGLYVDETEQAETILRTTNALLAKREADKLTSIPEWHSVKRDVMKSIAREKLRCNPDISQYLISTRGKKLVENVRDDIWGTGKDGNGGKNEMGEIWEELRDELPEELPANIQPSKTNTEKVTAKPHCKVNTTEGATSKPSWAAAVKHTRSEAVGDTGAAVQSTGAATRPTRADKMDTTRTPPATQPQKATPVEPKKTTTTERPNETASSPTVTGSGKATSNANKTASNPHVPGAGTAVSNTGQPSTPYRADVPKPKAAKCILIGNSQTEDINPDRFSEKTKLIKVKQYTIKQANEWVNSRNIMPHRDAEYITIHEITNDVRSDSVSTVVNNMKTLVNSVKNQFDKPKILISLGTPRDDGLQDKVSEVNSAIRDTFKNDRQVKTCHHQNLSERGRIIAKFYAKDKYHLNDTGTRILAANLRYSMEGKRGTRNVQGQAASQRLSPPYNASNRTPGRNSTIVKMPYEQSSTARYQSDSHQSQNPTVHDGRQTHDIPQHPSHQMIDTPIYDSYQGTKPVYDRHQGHYDLWQGNRPDHRASGQNNSPAPNVSGHDERPAHNVQEYDNYHMHANHQRQNIPIYSRQSPNTMITVPNVQQYDNLQEYGNRQRDNNTVYDNHKNNSQQPPDTRQYYRQQIHDNPTISRRLQPVTDSRMQWPIQNGTYQVLSF